MFSKIWIKIHLFQDYVAVEILALTTTILNSYDKDVMIFCEKQIIWPAG